MDRWLIIADPRCGGTVLRRTLDRHPDLECEGEMFDPQLPGFVQPNEDEWEAAIAEKFAESSGWHVQRYQIPWHSRGWSVLAATPGLRVIDLRRHDLTQQYCSWKVAMASNGWFSRQTVTEPIVWDQREHDRLTQQWVDDRKRIGYRMGGVVATLLVSYEGLVRDFDATVQSCMAFLNVTPVHLRPAMQRLEPLDYRSLFVGMPDDV